MQQGMTILTRNILLPWTANDHCSWRPQNIMWYTDVTCIYYLVEAIVKKMYNHRRQCHGNNKIMSIRSFSNTAFESYIASRYAWHWGCVNTKHTIECEWFQRKQKERLLANKLLLCGIVFLYQLYPVDWINNKSACTCSYLGVIILESDWLTVMYYGNKAMGVV